MSCSWLCCTIAVNFAHSLTGLHHALTSQLSRRRSQLGLRPRVARWGMCFGRRHSSWSQSTRRTESLLHQSCQCGGATGTEKVRECRLMKQHVDDV